MNELILDHIFFTVSKLLFLNQEVEGIKEAMTKRRKQEEEEDSEDRIVADVDDILRYYMSKK